MERTRKTYTQRNDKGDNGQANEGNDPMLAIAKASMLEKDMERRQETYVARERAYKMRIQELEDEILLLKENKTGWMAKDGKLSKLKQMQGQILSNIELVQDRTARILQEQERDLLKAFRARLYDVQTELDKEKSRKDDGAGAWIDKCNTLTSELEWSKGVADRLERVNQSLMQDNARLRSEFVSQDEDRNFIIMQLVSVKKENAKLRAEYTALEAEHTALKAKIEKYLDEGKMQTGVNGRFNLNHHASKGESEEKYREINGRLKRILLEERKSLQNLRQTYSNELKSRSELESLLRQCVEDVRKEIAKKKIDSGLLPSSGDVTRLYTRLPGLIPIENFTKEDRERAIELLLSKEHAISMIYAKVFPVIERSSNNLLDSKKGSNNLNDDSINFDKIEETSDFRRGNVGVYHEVDNERPNSSTLLGSPGARDQERRKVKLPSVVSLSEQSAANRPFTGQK